MLKGIYFLEINSSMLSDTDPATERDQDEQTIAIDFERLLAKYTDVVGG